MSGARTASGKTPLDNVHLNNSGGDNMQPKSLYRDIIDIPYMHRFVAVDGHTYEARNVAPGTWEMYIANIRKEWNYLDVVHTAKKMPTCMDLYNLLYGGH